MCTPSKILIVEDEMIVQMHLRTIVEGLGHTVVGAASNTAAASAKADSDPPDLVLMDIRLSRGDDGVATALSLREQHDCDVIFITALSDPETVARTSPVTAAGYLVKPFTAADVGAAVSTALTSRVPRQAARAVEEPATFFPEPDGVPRSREDGLRLVVYSHDTLGLGHLRRSLNLIRALAERTPGLSTLLVTGSPMAHKYELPPGTDYLKLPAVRKVGPDSYEPRSLSMSDPGIRMLRSSLLLRTIRDYSPDVLLVDHSPTGMNGELLPSLEWLQGRKTCTRILGLRDIIDDPDDVIARWKRGGVYDVLRDAYDHVLVYGTPEVYDTVEAYRFSAEIAAKTSFLNYVCDTGRDRNEPAASTSCRPLVAISIGGGDGGADTVVVPFLTMMRRFRDRLDIDVEVVLGPFVSRELEEELRSMAEGLPVVLRTFVPDPTELFRRADLVVSTAGYNTVAELLAHADRALLIPRVLHRREQLIRARRLEELGLVACLHPDEATPERLLGEVQRLLDMPEAPLARSRAESGVPLDGAERFAEFWHRVVMAGLSR